MKIRDVPDMPDVWRSYNRFSFLELLRQEHPNLLPNFLSETCQAQWSQLGQVGMPAMSSLSTTLSDKLPIGTTILTLKYADGVCVAGDRQATAGYQVAERRIEKVYKSDDYSAIAIAGVAGICILTARLFQTELEFYEKIHGEALTLEGKANFLSNYVRNNLQNAIQGLIFIPIFAGYDLKRKEGRIFKYDLTGGKYEEIDYYAEGSGGKDARDSLKKLYKRNSSRQEAIRLAIQALHDAAEEDIATGGPDFIRGIYPSIKTITKAGFEDVPETEIKQNYIELIQNLNNNNSN